jgi:hypothetical protein
MYKMIYKSFKGGHSLVVCLCFPEFLSYSIMKTCDAGSAKTIYFNIILEVNGIFIGQLDFIIRLLVLYSILRVKSILCNSIIGIS